MTDEEADELRMWRESFADMWRRIGEVVPRLAELRKMYAEDELEALGALDAAVHWHGKVSP